MTGLDESQSDVHLRKQFQQGPPQQRHQRQTSALSGDLGYVPENEATFDATQPVYAATGADPLDTYAPASRSPKPARSPTGSNFLSSSLFRRDGYHRMPSDGGIDLTNFSKLPLNPQYEDELLQPRRRTGEESPQGLGIRDSALSEARNRKSFTRKPVGSQVTSPTTPNSMTGLMGSGAGTASDRGADSPSPPPSTTPGMESKEATPQVKAVSKFKGSDSAACKPKGLGSFWQRLPRPFASKPGNVGPPPSYEASRVDSAHDQASPEAMRDGTASGNTGLGRWGRVGQWAQSKQRARAFSNNGPDEDDRPLHTRYGPPPSYCDSKKDVHLSRFNWLSIAILVLSIYSTGMSALWFIVSIVQPRWGRAISSNGGVAPSTANVVCSLFAKTIELSFVTVFVSFLGQVLTRRSFAKGSRGVTLAEMTMRNWVFQPGSLITHCETIPSAGITFLGAISLIATTVAMLYTTASEAMINPKIKFGHWESRSLEGLVTTTYANPVFVNEDCPTPLRDLDPMGESTAGGSCLDVQYSGQSYRNFMQFLTAWQTVRSNGTGEETSLGGRPVGTTLLYDNTTMTSAWIETEHGDVGQKHKDHGRIINNVTLAMPHPGVYAAATDPVNRILQPDDLSDVGEFSIKAAVVSPSVNVMCVNMNATELEPLVYTAWPDATTNNTKVEGQTIGWDNWADEVPVIAKNEYLNRTVVDDIFEWGPDYERRPPVFQLYPADFNILTNSSHIGPHLEWGQPRRDAIYMLTKSNSTEDYTMCEMRSWLSPLCSTHFNISGIAGAHMRAHCEDPDEENLYMNSYPPGTSFSPPDADWANLAAQWQLSMDLNGGTYNNDASNARILTQLVLTKPELSPLLPSMAEALAVLSSSTLTIASLSTPYQHNWDHPGTTLDPPVHEAFNASIRTQEYTSSHTFEWHNVFYVVLFLVLAINAFCLVYLLARSGFVTDFTEPQNLFAVALNSPYSEQISGSCGGGPEGKALVVPWQVGYARGENHYFFEEAKGAGVRDAKKGGGVQEVGVEREGDESDQTQQQQDVSRRSSEEEGDSEEGRLRERRQTASSYNRLSADRAWI